MIVPVDQSNIARAAAVHSASWQDSHRAFCTPAFVALHTPERQQEYLMAKIRGGSRVYMLITDRPAAVVSVTGSLIEDLYVLPERQNRGFGTRLLRHAIAQCDGTPTLWILENNADAARLYERMGFAPTGNRKHISDKLDEIEYQFT